MVLEEGIHQFAREALYSRMFFGSLISHHAELHYMIPVFWRKCAHVFEDVFIRFWLEWSEKIFIDVACYLHCTAHCGTRGFLECTIRIKEP